MEVAAKTGVDIIQQLLVIYIAGKEACEKIESQTSDSSFRKALRSVEEQTGHFITNLMEELSLFWDVFVRKRKQ